MVRYSESQTRDIQILLCKSQISLNYVLPGLSPVVLCFCPTEKKTFIITIAMAIKHALLDRKKPLLIS